ncbi:MAG: DUF4199 domain-containing protein [Bacteroidota bacterium]
MEKTSTRSVAIKYGIILGVICAILVAVIYIGQLNQNFGYIGIAATIAILYLAIKEYKDENGGYMSFGKGVGLCVLLTVIGGAISGVFDFVYTSFVDPDILQAILDEQMLKMEENPQMTDEMIEQARGFTENFFTPTVRLIGGLVSGLLGGAFWGLILSAIFKKDEPE